MRVYSIQHFMARHDGDWFASGNKYISPIAYDGPGGTYFVSSDEDRGVRRWTVRFMFANGNVGTASAYREFETPHHAEIAAKSLAMGEL